MFLEKKVPAVLCICCLCFAASLVTRPAASVRWQTLDRRVTDFREGARCLALIDARLQHADGETRLAVELSAQGPFVDASPGLEGVRGSNLRTARELERLANAGQLTVRQTAATGGQQIGSWRTVRRGSLPMRRLHSDGTLERVLSEELLLAISVESHELSEGLHFLDVLANEVVRLSVSVEVDESGGRIIAVTNPQPHALPELEP